MFIITNDWQISDQRVIEFYNQRGASEKVFDVQNNDFNWKCMPHSFLQENTVYLIIMAVAHIVYKWLIKSISKHIEGLSPKARLKQLIFRFVNRVAKITRSGRRQIIALATSNQKLLNFWYGEASHLGAILGRPGTAWTTYIRKTPAPEFATPEGASCG